MPRVARAMGVGVLCAVGVSMLCAVGVSMLMRVEDDRQTPIEHIGDVAKGPQAGDMGPPFQAGLRGVPAFLSDQRRRPDRGARFPSPRA